MFWRKSTSEHFAAFDAEHSPLEDIRAFVQGALLESPLSRKEIASLMLAIEEAVTNIIRHGYLYGPGKVRIRVRRTRSWIHIIITDSGRAYQMDPPADIPDIEHLAATARKGGLGLALIRKVTDHVEHKRVGDENVLTLSMRLRRSLAEPLSKSSWRRRVVWTGAAVVTLGTLIGFFVLNRQMASDERARFFSEWHQFGLTAAAAASQHILNDRSDAELDQFVVELKAAHSGVNYLIILSQATDSESGRTIRAHSELPELVHQPYERPRVVPIATMGHWLLSTELGLVYHFVETASIGGEPVGEVIWGVPKEVLSAQIAAERFQLMQWAFGLLVGGWLLVWLASAWMARPIQRLANSLVQAKDRTGPPVGSTSSDPEEIRQVMAAFQEATDTVARTERRIAERAMAQREMEESKQLQDALLPKTLPDIAGYEIGAICRMASHVGGDYYDLIPINSDQWLIIVADVAGKGLPAALTMTAFRTATRLIAAKVSSPRALLSALHNYLAVNHPSGPFVTALCCLLDTKTHKIEIASAGHPPLVVRRQDNRAILRVRPRGRPVGIPLAGESAFEETLGSEIIDLYELDWIVMFTDGVAEARQPGGETYGLDRIDQLVNLNCEGSSQELIDAIVRDVDQFSSDAMLKDDLTMLVLRRMTIRSAKHAAKAKSTQVNTVPLPK